MTDLDALALAVATDAEIARYASVCATYSDACVPEALVGNYLGHVAMHETVIKPMLRVLGQQRGSVVLDFACGPGRLTGLLADMEHLAVGVDVSRKALARAAQCCPRAAFVHVPGDGSLPFPPASVDAVVSVIALQHIQFFPVRHRYFQEFCRIVRPGGRLLVQLNADDSGKHVRWFERGTPEVYDAPDVVCNEGEICEYLERLPWRVLKTERTPSDTQAVSWAESLVGRPDSWLWVLAERIAGERDA